jgi:hypothetical protein
MTNRVVEPYDDHQRLMPGAVEIHGQTMAYVPPSGPHGDHGITIYIDIIRRIG